MTTVEIFAPAKINLTLHITGQRDDGYHLLDSLVTFAPAHDRLRIQSADTMSLSVEGPEADGVPTGMQNLALQAAQIYAETDKSVSVTLVKRLPVASGIGGGSADAAAAIRGMLMRRDDLAASGWQLPDDIAKQHAGEILALGADVPMCLMATPCRARGIGEKLEFVSLPPLPALLVNPRVPVPTSAIFQRLAKKDNPAMPEHLPEFADTRTLIDWLVDQRNDLQAPAIAEASVIGEVIDALASLDGCRLARMSGSGATCFGLFDDPNTAIEAGRVIENAYPDWWLVGGVLGDKSEFGAPRFI